MHSVLTIWWRREMILGLLAGSCWCCWCLGEGVLFDVDMMVMPVCQSGAGFSISHGLGLMEVGRERSYARAVQRAVK